jgi:hypothetical protein
LNCLLYCCQYKPACFPTEVVTSYTSNSSNIVSVLTISAGKMFLYISAMVMVEIDSIPLSLRSKSRFSYFLLPRRIHIRTSDDY